MYEVWEGEELDEVYIWENEGGKPAWEPPPRSQVDMELDDLLMGVRYLNTLAEYAAFANIESEAVLKNLCNIFEEK